MSNSIKILPFILYVWPGEVIKIKCYINDCGGLNMLAPVRGTIRRCGLIVVGVGMCHFVGGNVSLWGWAYRPSS